MAPNGCELSGRPSLRLLPYYPPESARSPIPVAESPVRSSELLARLQKPLKGLEVLVKLLKNLPA